jgi:hypothetical protein
MKSIDDEDLERIKNLLLDDLPDFEYFVEVELMHFLMI